MVRHSAMADNAHHVASSFPRLRVIEGHLAQTLLRPRRPLELFNERSLFRGLVRIHAHYREVAHFATHAIKLGLQISQCWNVSVKAATLDPSWHAFFPKGLSRFPGHSPGDCPTTRVHRRFGAIAGDARDKAEL